MVYLKYVCYHAVSIILLLQPGIAFKEECRLKLKKKRKKKRKGMEKEKDRHSKLTVFEQSFNKTMNSLLIGVAHNQ